MSVAVFLQGPHGPFFAQLAKRLSQSGVITHKINFNGGDRYFAWADFQADFTGGESDWSAFFSDYLSKNNVDTVFCYGDCRRLHTIAKSICESKGIAFGVFEEGYLRPDFITLEFGGLTLIRVRTGLEKQLIVIEPESESRLNLLGKLF
ncbi:hypothetical protein [Microbulbifer sp. VAAF005]|uniref:capsular polysaccharide export protein, LipB/KpsS family n=1 Tax=Microbulbifer sp. VAAF005 TaxID=3034230 RepID=UPI0024ADBCAE|nr:hypothetical protein [Microbulbifer sp. VAAF005]WHI48549.1 hypothetical protein P0078_09325 [Microbulbifer sp. VAAF005]